MKLVKLTFISQRMLPDLITLTPGCRNELIECQKANVQIAALLMMDVKTRWNSKLQLLEHAYRFREFTLHWFQNPKYNGYRPHFTTQEECRPGSRHPGCRAIWERALVGSQ